MKRVFVDTGAWYALVDRQDPDHAAVYACLQRYKGRFFARYRDKSFSFTDCSS